MLRQVQSRNQVAETRTCRLHCPYPNRSSRQHFRSSSRKAVVVDLEDSILPTGAGKSMLFMLHCTLPDPSITILIVPLVLLRADFLRR